jgi:3-oxoacyl-(acyl-carrier-protein) synthase
VVARALGVRGPVLIAGGAEASGAVAIANAIRLVRTGQVDVVVAGAGQALQGPLLEHLRAQGFAARASGKPFDATSPGFTAAEGAAFVVIEGRAHAVERGATVLASIAGLGETFDSLAEPLANSDPAEAGRTMQAALGDAGFMQNQVDLVVSCADGRRQVDFADGMGVKRTFGRHAYFAGVTSVAGALGQTLAASGPLSLAMALEAMRRQEVFPVAGLEATEPDLDLAFVRATRPEKVDCVLVTSLGMGGTNISMVLHAVS